MNLRVFPYSIGQVTTASDYQPIGQAKCFASLGAEFEYLEDTESGTVLYLTIHRSISIS